MSQDTTFENARASLRNVIEVRSSARRARDEAKASLARADSVLVEMKDEVAQYSSAAQAAETTRAGEVASAIKRGAKPNVTLSRSVTEARHAEADVRSRHAVAAVARDQLAAELAETEGALDRAERAVTLAAFNVIMIEAAPLATEIETAKQALLATYDKLSGLAYLGVGFIPGTLPPLSSEIGKAIMEAHPLAHAIDLIRPPRIISAGSPAAIASARWRAYLKALSDNAGIVLADIPSPEPAAPSVPRYSEHEASRVRAAADMAGERAA